MGWNDYDTDDAGEYISETQAVAMKKHPDVVHYFKGGGHRKKYNDKYMEDRQANEKVIDPKFHQTQFQHGSNCVWLSTCMLINTIDEKVSNYMVNQLVESKTNPNSPNIGKFEWMLFSGVPDSQCESTVTLQSMLQQDDNIPYQLKRMKMNPDTFIDFIFKENTYGIYVCQLITRTGEDTHVIGIDTTNNKIYDCLERYVLDLTMDNLDHCCGPYQGGLSKIKRCYQIISMQKKKTTKK